MIYITGDTHGEFQWISKKRLKKLGIELGKGDYLIVCGDFGLCWKRDRTFEYNCNNFALKDYTILWIQGNHENYDMIADFPLEEWHEGKVRHIIRDKVILLERGQVFEIDGKTFFTFGGASSHDTIGGILDRNDPDFKSHAKLARDRYLPYRIIHESWWEQELPSKEEMAEGIKNLTAHEFKVDYVLTHCCSTRVLNKFENVPRSYLKPDILIEYLETIEESLDYKHWFFGHYHDNMDVDNKHTLLYHAVIPVEGHIPLGGRPIPGRPRYHLGDKVKVRYNDTFKIGTVYVIDAYGTSEQDDEPSYDVLVEAENCLYKHICESEIIGTES